MAYLNKLEYLTAKHPSDLLAGPVEKVLRENPEGLDYRPFILALFGEYDSLLNMKVGNVINTVWPRLIQKGRPYEARKSNGEIKIQHHRLYKWDGRVTLGGTVAVPVETKDVPVETKDVTSSDLEERLAKIEERVAKIEGRLAGIKEGLTVIWGSFAKIRGSITKIEETRALLTYFQNVEDFLGDRLDVIESQLGVEEFP